MPSTQEIVDYLRANPSFFEEHGDLLTELSLGNASGATPFHERQLPVLKDRISQHEATIKGLVESARRNQKFESDFLQVAVGLFTEKRDGGSSVETASELIKRQFDIEEVVIMLKSSAADTGRTDYDAVWQRVMHKGSVCDDRLPSTLHKSIFGSKNQSVASCAFIPLLREDELLGVMILGSSSKSRFQPDVGVMFLDRIGRLIGGYICGRFSQP